MASSDKNRFCVFLMFIVLLIAFGALYQPSNASSGPAHRDVPAVRGSGK